MSGAMRLNALKRYIILFLLSSAPPAARDASM